MVDCNLSIDFLGLKLRNPLMLTEGPLSGDGTRIRRAAEHPVGLIFTKGIRPEPARSPSPFIRKSGRDSLLNADWSDIGFARWLEEIRELDPAIPLVTSIAKNYVTSEQAADMAVALEKAGARIISMVDYDPEELIAAVRAARPRIRVPLMVKLPPMLPRLEEVLKRLVAAGAEAIAAMDSIGPVLEVDVETGLPVMGSPDGTGYLSGAAIRPVTVRYIYEIARLVDVPVVGVGGVASARDVVEMIMVGATGVGMVAAPMLRGLDVFDRAANDLRQFLTQHGIEDVRDIRGLTRRRIAQMQPVYGLTSTIDPAICTGCGNCARSCFVQAIASEGKHYWVETARCVGCSLCASVCPVQAIKLIEPPAAEGSYSATG